MIRKLPKVVYIEGYASMIYEMACLAADSKPAMPRLKMVKGTSEKIHPHYQDMSMKVFGRRMISEYGSGESGIIAFECPSGNMHLNMEGVFVETDAQQEIIVTNFRSLSFPVIRYKLGDTIRLRESGFRCPCGMAHPVVEEVIGRVGKVIRGRTGRYPSMTLYSMFKNLYFNQGLKLSYQVHQHEPGKLEIRVKEECTPEQADMIVAEAAKYFGSDIEAKVLPGSELRMHEGKMRDFVSTISDDHNPSAP
jgi:phenylacetate-CoA ligase